MSYPLTLLSPARDFSVAQAAIQAGCDAVYIGAEAFGARQAAGNSLEDIERLVQYARPWGVQVLVTLNTLLTDSERQQAVEMAWRLYEIGVDALIIQDLRLLNEPMPPLRLHASTQCDNRTPEQVVRLQQLGFRRAVLARELTLSEIRAIRQATLQACQDGQEPIELEAFVHGALCVSYSGRCYMSEVLMHRSANRGCCAQMCRQRYDLLDEDGNEIRDDAGETIHQRYLLSLQDLDRSAYLEELVDAGITTFKIEGRLKDKDYVTNITAFYRRLLDRLFPHQVRTHHRYQYSFEPNPEKTFHRGGIDYFLHGRTRGMASWQSPKSTGEYIGEVLSWDRKKVVLSLREGVSLHAGDGITYGDSGFSVSKIEGNCIYPHHKENQPLSLARGTRLFRNQDVTFLASLSAERRIPVRVGIEVTPTGFHLTLTEVFSKRLLSSLFVTADRQEAKNAEQAVQTMRRQLAKMGDTPYTVESIDAPEQAYFVPIQQWNQWRRELVANIETPLPSTEKKDGQDNLGVEQPIFQPEDSQSPLMTCRYCLLYELGHCRKEHPMAREPHFLRLKNGTRMRLKFDCKQCQMTIHSD